MCLSSLTAARLIVAVTFYIQKHRHYSGTVRDVRGLPQSSLKQIHQEDVSEVRISLLLKRNLQQQTNPHFYFFNEQSLTWEKLRHG